MKIMALAALLCAAAPALADETLGEEGFRSIAEGYTLYFERDGQFYGAEQYLKGNRSRWMDGSGTCQEGRWFEMNGALCFTYEGNPAAQCWQVIRRDGEIFVRSERDPDGLGELHMSGRDARPLNCPGPRIGV
ncbi:hypothetical protein FDP22_14215 [Paroceanicella profunda]|uniref:DUF995 domain-containing protein n=1 Tax=Paroceanicella profunda TaxID=2579971 RepID=A0A5B8FWF4_9RHOB|nr:hypothetical protein [Paroceanicella profunda]QDL92835.1 hypothetical protein FDP22_14215 [Paroceanicella profunda]